jgi:hypothetical protein
MNGTGPGLYPIIRRVRRPLIIQDDDGPTAAVQPVEVVPMVQPEEVVNYANPPKGEKRTNGRQDKKRT